MPGIRDDVLRSMTMQNGLVGALSMVCPLALLPAFSAAVSNPNDVAKNVYGPRENVCHGAQA